MILNTLFILICLTIIVFQDLKYRRIHVFLPLLLFVIAVFKQDENFREWDNLFKNILFFLITFSVLTVYLSIKNKRFINPFEGYFGLGDFLFFLAISPLFHLYNFILYFILSLLFSLIIQLLLLKFMKNKTIPLAGFASLFLILIICKDLFFNFKKMTLIV